MTRAELVERLEAATGPERIYDHYLFFALEPHLYDEAGRRGLLGDHIVPAYTASIDAAVALVERVLPGWSWECRASGTGDKGQAAVWNPTKRPGRNDEQRAYNCATPAIALCIAALKALEGRDG